jgi:uncharacterized protein (UPF0264 family)
LQVAAFRKGLSGMPKLLVSVRNAEEAALALAAGVALVDIKEPQAGSLGAASPQTIGEILRLVNRRAETSVACGELRESGADVAEQLFGAGGDHAATRTVSPDFVKVGLSGCGSIGDWPEKWHNLLAPMQNLTPVAVIYADWRLAGAPSPAEVLNAAKSLARAVVLIDTFDKSGPGLLRIVSPKAVHALIDEMHESHMQVAVAGQLTFDDAIAIAPFNPDYIGVRGGVCRRGRNGDIDPVQVIRWQSAIASLPRATGV